MTAALCKNKKERKKKCCFEEAASTFKSCRLASGALGGFLIALFAPKREPSGGSAGLPNILD